MMKNFNTLFNEARNTSTFACEKEKLRFAMQIHAMLQSLDISRSEFAKRLGKTKGYITKIMRGDTNFTIETMIAMAHALGGSVNVNIKHPWIRETTQTSSRIVVYHTQNPSSSSFPTYALSDIVSPETNTRIN
jgi:transcriptional regulator with XRE-family HTH domain